MQEIGGILTFNLAYMGMNDKLIHQAVSTLYERASPSLLHVADHCYSPGLSAAAVFSWTASTEWSGQRTHWCRPKAAGGGGAAAGGGGGGGGGRRIRIGFVSANLKDHTIGKLFAETVCSADKLLHRTCTATVTFHTHPLCPTLGWPTSLFLARSSAP